MGLVLLVFLGGALTIVSPCILPVLPFVFARGGRSFATSTLPLLIGMALTFAAVATLTAVAGSWAVNLNSWGRWVALVVMALFGLALISRKLADWVSRPLVAFGNRIVESGEREGRSSVVQSLLLGVAVGFLWSPCAGPILGGLILTGAAINGPNAHTSLLLLTFGLGAAASLAIVMLAGGKVVRALKGSLGAGEWVRRGLGVLVLAAAVAIGMGWDTGVLTQLSLNGTNSIEQALMAKLHPSNATPAQQAGGGMMMSAHNQGSAPGGGMMMSAQGAGAAGGAMMAMAPKGAGASLPAEGQMPPLAGAVAWLNSPPLTAEALRGKVVLIDFWTYSCINCLRELPFVKAWAAKYGPAGLVIIGVHTPEFAFEKIVGNVQKAIKDLGVTYPVAVDSDYKIWGAFNNQYWPALYFIDANGTIRHHHFGEGEYDESERIIKQLLHEAGAKDVGMGLAEVSAQGVQAPASNLYQISPETYVGYARAEHFASPQPVAKDASAQYTVPTGLTADQWALGGSWKVTSEGALLQQPGGKIVYRFNGRDLHLVLGPMKDGHAVHFRVRLDGKDPADSKGADIAADGSGVVTEQRLYQLIRLTQPGAEHTVEIDFQDAGVEAFAFTFG
ncbi:MAG TPA: cytochrome c biogenesis protein DipZ [Steroidobacteraceae bacterium]|jgi:cytochrome c biogenesis protein CcdA/thiol-disulfide isomerase/thioredoxin|nr:cytochrome c biogenesis protein DipZ [Steroidobacteraceae bacterium]